jgi:ubiquitin carboxyl-terminal hydrolase 4/11/15
MPGRHLTADRAQCRWWKEAQDGAGIDAHGVPYASTPAGGPTSYGMKVLSLIMNDYTAAFTLRKADDLAVLPDAPAKAGARSYALVAADLFDKARAW